MAGLYVHIPFCRTKCLYCDFFSRAVRSDMASYVDALINELTMRRPEMAEAVETVYIGGGTPSLLPPELLRHLTEAIQRVAPLSTLREFTIESNPDDITPDTLRFWQDLGIDRVSIGVQSFHQPLLSAVGRHHSPAMSLAALECLADAGMNYSADLIFGLPGESVAMWKTDLSTLLSFAPSHISAYLLSYEPGTPLYAMLQKGKVQEVSEQVATEMYEVLCMRMADRGYRHYEISNFALAGCEAKHNSAYWTLTPYLGLGASAHSFSYHPSGGAGELSRSSNVADIKAYIKAVESGINPSQIEDETPANRLNDYIITSLRTLAGLNLGFMKRMFGAAEVAEFMINAHRQIRMGNLVETSEGCLMIPQKRWLTADAILRELIV